MGIRNVAGQIGSCLEFLHSERIAHGDVKVLPIQKNKIVTFTMVAGEHHA